MNALAVLLLCICVGASEVSAASTSPELWDGLEQGPYGVGFSVRHERDPDRLFGPKDSPRPVQMLVWYPASTLSDQQPVSYEDYFLTAVTESGLSESEEGREREHLLEVREMALESGASEDRFDRQLRRSTWAIANADPATGPFPLVVFAPGFGSNAFQNTVLCEYLASHGFVVTAIPSIGPRSRWPPHTLAGAQAQIDDIRFVIRTMGKLRYVNAERTGVVGYSWGGMVVLLAAMGGGESIDAVAALDPHIMVKKGHLLAQTAPSYAPSNLHSPVMLPIAAAKEWKERDVSFFDELTGTEAWLLRFKDFTHGEFSSTIIQFLKETLPDREQRDIDRIRFAYATLCRYLQQFFSAHLEGDNAARAFLRADPGENGVPAGVLTIERRSPQLGGE